MNPHEQQGSNPQNSDHNSQNSAHHIANSAFAKDKEPLNLSHINLANIDPQKASQLGKKPRKFSPKRLGRWFNGLSSKKKFAVIIGAVIVIALAIFALYWFVLRPEPKTAQFIDQEEVIQEAPNTYSRTTGLPVSDKINQRQPTGVMIENSPDARPQSGLLDADIVYEAIAESGITRFMAIFHDTQPRYVGPVRSVRPYYLDWLVPYNASIAHVGGSPQALNQIKVQKIRDLDQFGNPAQYQRVSSRYSPHNVYTDLNSLDKLEIEKGYSTTDFTAFARKTEVETYEDKTATQVDLNISGPLYNPSFRYNSTNNNYVRYQEGKPHLDEKSGTAIKSDVVVVLVTRKSLHPDGVHTIYKTNGSGVMYVFQGGKAFKGGWRKKDRASQIELVKGGQPFQLNPGKTWVTIVSEESAVKYK